MLRSRVRRSFTVEVKSKSRQSQNGPENSPPSLVNWAALDPAPDTPSPFEPSWSDEPESHAAPVNVEKPRRILQSLIADEPEPEVAEPVLEREPPLPRVRRVKPPQERSERAQPEAARSQAARPDAVWSFADVDARASENAAPTPSAPPTSVAVVFAPVPAMPAHKSTRTRASEPVLAPGQRWKRRLPRVCR